jgi:predicted oxidoreductase
MRNEKEKQIKEVLEAMSLTLDNDEWKELLKKYHELKGIKVN